MRLAYGEISLYRIYRTGITGVIAPTGFNFGLVDQLSPYGISYTSIGQSVLFEGSGVCTLAFSGHTYTIIDEVKIVTTEIALP